MKERTRLQIVEILTAFGIDPSKVAREDMSAEGYYVFHTGLDGKRIWNPADQAPLTSLRSWPVGVWEKIEEVLSE